MKLNCKPGDLALVVKGKRSAGLVVRVSHLAKNDEKVVSKCGIIVVVDESSHGKYWHLSEGYTLIRCEGEALWLPVAPDYGLRPIRDSDGQDETLTWKEVPKETENA